MLQALWELDCIPTGMEAFVASNDSQWNVIRRVIDECDYYVLIIGGRYGSITADGVSYTEMEYEYAKKIGVPVLAFVHSSPETIPAGKSESSEDGRAKLSEFKRRVMQDHPVRTWNSPQELGGVVSRSVIREIKTNPRPGWVRNDGSSPVRLLEQVQKLTQENSELRDQQNENLTQTFDSELSSGSDKIFINGRRDVLRDGEKRDWEDWQATATWDDVFKDIGPAVINEASEEELKRIVARFHGWSNKPDNLVIYDYKIFPETLNQILIQYRALGLIDRGTRKRGINDTNRYWKITAHGDKYLTGILAKKKTAMPLSLGLS